MVKSLNSTVKTPKKILITQPKPESDKSPYFELAKKHGVELTFHPFTVLEEIPVKDFRKQKIDIATFTAVIFTSRHAIDNFFRMAEEVKVSINQNTKYFCITEAVALYLQKFILYRKRKVFYGADGTNKSLFDVINKHKQNERFLYVCSENQHDNDIVTFLKSFNCDYKLGLMYRTISNNVKTVMEKNAFDLLCFFTPAGVKSLFDSYPQFSQNDTIIGAFGSNTAKAVEDSGLKLLVKAPAPGAPSMVAALDKFLMDLKK